VLVGVTHRYVKFATLTGTLLTRHENEFVQQPPHNRTFHRLTTHCIASNNAAAQNPKMLPFLQLPTRRQCTIACLFALLNILHPILLSPVAAVGWWYGAELVYCGWWWYRRSSSWGGSCCMNCPCGVHVPADDEHRSCIPHYFVTRTNIIHNTWEFITFSCKYLHICWLLCVLLLLSHALTAIFKQTVDTKEYLIKECI